MEFFDVMRSRISIRKYKDIPVEQEKIDELMAMVDAKYLEQFEK